MLWNEKEKPMHMYYYVHLKSIYDYDYSVYGFFGTINAKIDS